MGSPNRLEAFSIGEMSGLLALARTSAFDFRSQDARIAALEQFRASLLPLVVWFEDRKSVV